MADVVKQEERRMDPGYLEVREIEGSPFDLGVRYGEFIKPEFGRIVAQYAESVRCLRRGVSRLIRHTRCIVCDRW